ncbi:hypothetical protein NDU88_002668 [Pleurodeles waltl]|uniref:Uncharacterized protein n=1 Tax=Pleurodeles waltl TaxID=8319 RepID=A0AAV7W0C9_PLEWA|nr:hypothetical protein NDU88_002668 [Pleurodeles waltl]
MLETFRTAGGQKDSVRDEGEAGVNGERKTDRGGGAEQRETMEQEADDIGDEENEATQEGAPEARTKEPSNDPGGSWLTKKPQKYLYTYRGVLLFLLPVPPWSRPEFSESTDLGDKRRKNDRVRRREINRVTP